MARFSFPRPPVVRRDVVRRDERGGERLSLGRPACLRPAHTRYDGDVAFAVSCGGRTADLDAVGAAAFATVGRAIEAAVRTATGRGGIPGMGGE